MIFVGMRIDKIIHSPLFLDELQFILVAGGIDDYSGPILHKDRMAKRVLPPPDKFDGTSGEIKQGSHLLILLSELVWALKIK
jgi:hypothetical protein